MAARGRLTLLALFAACAAPPERDVAPAAAGPTTHNAWVRELLWTACPSERTTTPYCVPFVGAVDGDVVGVVCHTQGMASARGVRLYHAWLVLGVERGQWIVPPCVVRVEPLRIVPLPHDRTVMLPFALRVAGQESIALAIPIGARVLLQIGIEGRDGELVVSNVYEVTS